MVRPERRTRADVVAAIAIGVVVVVVGVFIWWTSDARATVSRPAAAPLATLPSAEDVPASLRELWRAASPKTTTPVVVGGAVVTGDGRTVEGRDPATGEVAWSYARDRELCGVSWVYQYAVAVYPDRRGCGQVSTIDARTGRRGPARTSYADRHVTLSSDGTAVLSAGENRLELWRSDMVRMLSYGALDAPFKPDVPATPLCRFVSAAASSEAVSVLADCPDEPDLRLTLLRPSDEEDTPNVRVVPQPGIGADSGAKVIAVAGTTTAVYVPTPRPTVHIVDEQGTTTASVPLPRPPAPQSTATYTGDLITWWTGDHVLVFDDDLRYRFMVTPAGADAPLGPGATMAGRLLVPVTGGYDVFDAESGAGERHIPVPRDATAGPVVPAVAGELIVEQRGDRIVALGA